MGLTVKAEGDILVVRGPRSAEGLALELLEHKLEILQYFQSRRPGDGRAPPMDRPPATEQELRRLIDDLADPEAFALWLDWAMKFTDPAEASKEGPYPHFWDAF